jgi:5'(3')-deoxyribonucleotidase
MIKPATDAIALIDLDGTVADYDGAMYERMRLLQAPEETPYGGRDFDDKEPPHVEARRKLIQRSPGFWKDLAPIERGLDIVDELRALEFELHVLTKGPRSTPSAWSEKVEWCHHWLPDAHPTVTSDKSLVYGRTLVDDFPPYFEAWRAQRPNGLVVCVAHPWNADYGVGGKKECHGVIRYTGTNMNEVRQLLARARHRKSGESL